MISPANGAPPRPVRILIVDDSAVMRSLLRSILLTDQRLEVAGTAIDGASALRAMESIHPDLILLDVEMPVMDGLDTLKQMRARGSRIPVIMCSSFTQRGGRITIEALASGAADYVTKPAGQLSREAAVTALAAELIPKIVALTASHQAAALPFQSSAGHSSAGHSSASLSPAAREILPSGSSSGESSGLDTIASNHGDVISTPWRPFSSSSQPSTRGQEISPIPPSVVLIGVSTGGPAALDVLLPALPATFPLPILIVQHMPELFTRLLAERLDSRCPLRVKEASDGESLRGGTVYIAKGNQHMEVSGGQRSPVGLQAAPAVRLTQEAPENHCRPAVDVLFRTAVAVYGSRILGVILTGMGSDGLSGSRLIRDQNGTIIAQDQATSAVWGMPGMVAHAGLAQRVLPLQAIAPELIRLCCRNQREAHQLRKSTV